MLELGRIKWALRKVSLPVSGSGLVLDVGSGGNPYLRSDVLLDRLIGAEHRCGVNMMIDRPVVFGDAQKMPFKDKAFEFVVASHILEHMREPAIFLKELSRVGKAGYIETPNFIFERMIPYSIHCLEIASVNGVLHIHKKRKPVEDDFIGNLGFLSDDDRWKCLFHEMPNLFHVRHAWTGKIEYKIQNPDDSCDWIEEVYIRSEKGGVKQSYLEANNIGWREFGLAIMGSWHKLRRIKRLQNFDIFSILVCPECKGELEKTEKVIYCGRCRISYPSDPYPDFTHGKKK